MFSTTLTSCSKPSSVEKQIEIKNNMLNDKVKACGMGIGISESLSAHLALIHTSPTLDAKSNELVKTHISAELQDLPKKDRLKFYEDYCKCIAKTL